MRLPERADVQGTAPALPPPRVARGQGAASEPASVPGVRGRSRGRLPSAASADLPQGPRGVIAIVRILNDTAKEGFYCGLTGSETGGFLGAFLVARCRLGVGDARSLGCFRSCFICLARDGGRPSGMPPPGRAVGGGKAGLCGRKAVAMESENSESQRHRCKGPGEAVKGAKHVLGESRGVVPLGKMAVNTKVVSLCPPVSRGTRTLPNSSINLEVPFPQGRALGCSAPCYCPNSRDSAWPGAPVTTMRRGNTRLNLVFRHVSNTQH